MFKQKMILEVKGSNDRIYKFECEPDAPLGECHDALCSMKSYIIEQIQSQDKQPSQEESCDDCECKKEEEK